MSLVLVLTLVLAGVVLVNLCFWKIGATRRSDKDSDTVPVSSVDAYFLQTSHDSSHCHDHSTCHDCSSDSGDSGCDGGDSGCSCD